MWKSWKSKLSEWKKMHSQAKLFQNWAAVLLISLHLHLFWDAVDQDCISVYLYLFIWLKYKPPSVINVLIYNIYTAYMINPSYYPFFLLLWLVYMIVRPISFGHRKSTGICTITQVITVLLVTVATCSVAAIHLPGECWCLLVYLKIEKYACDHFIYIISDGF